MIAKGFPTIAPEIVLNQITEEQLLHFYLGVEVVPSVINSPLRVDNNPSFGLYYNSRGNIKFKDFSTGAAGSIYEIFMYLWNLSYNQVIYKIFKDTPKILEGLSAVSKNITYTTYNRSLVHLDETLLKVRVRNWKYHDLNYWSSYGISKEGLEFGKIYPISHIFITKDTKTCIISAEKYAYVYYEKKEDKLSLKIYQPFSDFFKWRSQHDSSVWDLWAQLPSIGDKLIITSSRKDALCIWENTGIPATSLQAENVLPKTSVINQLKQRFNKIYVLYDNDFTKEKNWGYLFGKKLATTYNLIQITIPDNLKAKDASDLYKQHGKQVFTDTIFKLIKHYGINTTTN